VKTVIYSIVFLTITFITFHGCSVDADRDNPLDPKGDIYNPPASLTGNVSRISTSDPIADAYLLLSPGSFASHTDENGDYIIAADIYGPYDLLVTHPDYKDIETQVSLVRNSPVSADFKMDALTKIDSVSVTSQRITIDYWADIREYLVNVYVEISDADGSTDIDSSIVECSFLDELVEIENEGGSEYILSLSEDMFPGSDIENAIGIDFTIRLIDKNGDTLVAPPQETRTLLDFSFLTINPDKTGPDGYTDGNPTFYWAKPNPDIIIEHDYRIKIFRDTNDQLRYERKLWEGMENFVIAETMIYYLLDDTLSADDYYWTIQLEDNYGNFTRSVKTLFGVQL